MVFCFVSDWWLFKSQTRTTDKFLLTSLQLHALLLIFDIPVIIINMSCSTLNHTTMTVITDRLLNEKKCPCGKTSRSDLARIPRTAFMKLFLFWLPLKRYQCYACMRKKWIME